MISKDINGNNLSSRYTSTVRSDSRKFRARLKDSGGNEIDCAIKRLEILRGSCSSEIFTVGSVVGASLSATLTEVSTDLKKQRITVEIGLLTDADNDVWEYVKEGEFLVTDVKKTIYNTTITGHGRLISDSGTTFTAPSVKTLARLRTEFQAKLGCSVGIESGIDTTLEVNIPDGVTTYQALQIAASVVGGYWCDLPAGGVRLCRYKTAENTTITAGLMTSLPEMEEQNFEITGVRCVVSEASEDDEGTISEVGYESGSPVNFQMNNQYMTQGLFDNACERLIGYSYRPGRINMSLGDPRFESSDVINVRDIDNTVYRVPLHRLKHIYDGGFRTEFEAVRGSDESNQIGTKTPFQIAIQSIRSGIVAAKSIATKAKRIAADTAQYFWFVETGTDTGAHITEIPREDFLADPNNGGGNLLARSNGIAARDGLTELATFSQDGVTVGIDDSTHNHLSIDYHSMQMVDKEGETYFYISDLRDENGECEIQERFISNGGRGEYNLLFEASARPTVTVDDVATEDWNIYWGVRIIFNDPVTEGSVIDVTYKTTEPSAKAYTLGTRLAGSTVGPMSYAEGVDTEAAHYTTHAEGYGTSATGASAHAEGRQTEASGWASHAEGAYTDAIGDCSHARGLHTTATDDAQTAMGKYNASKAGALLVGNGDSEVRSNALELDWVGNLSISGTLTQSSDKRLKDHVAYLGADAEEFIRNLQPAHFRKDGADHVGFYAQDVEEIDKWHCMTGAMNDHMTLSYIEIIAPLVAYCQALEKRIEQLEKED